MEEGELIVYAMASTAGFFVVSGFAFYIAVAYFKTRFRKQEELLRLTLDSIEKEQQRMGKDFHDSLNPSLAAIGMSVERLRAVCELERIDTGQVFDDVSQLLTEAQKKVRVTAHNLKPVDIENGFLAALDNFSDKVFQRRQPVLLYIRNASVNNEFVEINLFRITQELIMNSLKYSSGSYIKIYIFSFSDRWFQIIYKDDGVGLNPSEKATGIGSRNILNRVAVLKGEMKQFENKPSGFGMHLKFDKVKW